MEVKKSPKADLEGKKSTWLLVGYVVVLAFMFVAFEWTQRDVKIDTSQAVADLVFEEEIIPITETPEQATPPPPEAPKVAELLEIVDDKAEIDESTTIINEDNVAPVEVKYVPVQVVEEEPEEQTIFEVVENMPDFPGGQAALMQYLAKNIKYPTIAQENGTQGQVIAQFVIQADGTLSDLKIVKSVDPLLDAEAMRVIKEMPKWQPGKQRGIAVATRVTVPIRFRLMDSDSAPSTDSNKNQENTIFDVVEHAPEFPGGMEACLKYMYKNIKYPAVAMEAGIQGQVVIQIVIDKDGKIHDPKIVRGVSPELNAEAVRVISNMPQWIPGKQKGKNVATRFTLPVRFRLA